MNDGRGDFRRANCFAIQGSLWSCGHRPAADAFNGGISSDERATEVVLAASAEAAVSAATTFDSAGDTLIRLHSWEALPPRERA